MSVESTGRRFEDSALAVRLEAISSAGKSFRVPTIPIWQAPAASADSVVIERQVDQKVLDVESSRRQRIDTPDGPIWLDGHVILCACPTCQAPLSMRLELTMASCWRCQDCVELTPAQRRAARAALQEALRRQNDHPEQPARWAVGPDEPATQLVPSRRDAAGEPGYELGPGRDRWTVRERIQAIPAWLLSFLLHLILIMILALILLPQSSLIEQITITTFLDSSDQPGGEIRLVDIDHQLSDDLLPAPLLEMGEEELREFKLRADQDARELQVDDAPAAALPDLGTVRRNLTTATGQTASLLSRDPRVRSEIVQREGGSTLTEAAVSRGLRWLASVQNQDGSWSLENYSRSSRPNNTGDVAGTSLALLPFLGAGQTHEFGVYKSTVAKGLQWLIEQQRADGDLRDSTNNQYGMYAHGQAAIVLVEAYAMTGDQKLRDPAQRAIRFIEKAQHERGGWRYQPGQEGDTSVFGWQLMALQSARASGSGLEVDEATLKLADYYLDTVSRKATEREASDLNERFRQSGVLYRYQPGREPTAPMTAEALLCRMYLGWQADDPRLTAAVDWLYRYHLPDKDGDFNVYYWYYGMQAMHHFGGPKWESWNRRVRDLLILTQETRGRYPGSWDPDQDEWGRRAGRIYVTSLAVCTLEVYYRHLPLFKQLDLN